MPILIATPESIAETWLGAFACADGSQMCSGKIPALIPKPKSASQNNGASSARSLRARISFKTGPVHTARKLFVPGLVLPGNAVMFVVEGWAGLVAHSTSLLADALDMLGDALAWGIEQYKPGEVVDLATLTGGVVVALGSTMAGLMSNSDASFGFS